MNDQKIALLLRQITDCDQTLCESPIFTDESERSPFPLVAVDLERVPLPVGVPERRRVSYMPVLMERVELDVALETIRRARQSTEARMQLINAHLRRSAAELELLLDYGIVCYSGIPHARQFAERINPSLPDPSRVSVGGDDLVDPLVSASFPAEDPPGQNAGKSS